MVFMASGAWAQDEAANLAAILQDANASLYAKTLACKQAAQTGTSACVPALAAVLRDETLSHPARIALLQIPGPEATQALCEALTDAKEGTLLGLVGTLGQRRDPAAVAHLTPYLMHDDAQVVRATAVAIGTIGTADALATLEKRFAEADDSQKVLLIDGLLACAQREDAACATRVYQSILAQRQLPVTARSGAIRGLLLTPGADACAELERLFADEDDGVFLAALTAARDLKSPDATPTLLTVLTKANADRQTLLLELLDCRGAAAARLAVLEMAKNAEFPAQTAAIRALAGMPDEEAVMFLLTTATGENPAAAAAAADALTRMETPELEQKIIACLETARGKACIPLIGVCRDRKIAAATPVLLPLLMDADDEVRLAAITALGNTVSGENVELLVAHLLNPASPTELEAVKGSLRLVCNRSVDPDAVAAKLAAAYADAPLASRCALLELFGALGGKVAIDAVQHAVADPADAIQDTATRVLGEWPDTDAAPVLLAVMNSQADNKFKTRALRGYIRIVRQMDTSNDHRFHMCMEALALSQRDEEKVLLVDALGRITTPAALAKLSEFLDQPTFAQQAAVSALQVGKALATQQPDAVAEVMRKIVAVTENPDIRRQAEEVLQP